MLFNNNHNNIINIIDRKLSKSIMLFKWKANIIKNKTKRKLTKITLKKLIINKKLVFYIFDIDFGAKSRTKINNLIIVNSKIIFILYLLTFNIIINDIGAIIKKVKINRNESIPYFNYYNLKAE